MMETETSPKPFFGIHTHAFWEFKIGLLSLARKHSSVSMKLSPACSRTSTKIDYSTWIKTRTPLHFQIMNQYPSPTLLHGLLEHCNCTLSSVFSIFEKKEKKRGGEKRKERKRRVEKNRK
jgi:hypothetical protein